MPRTAYITHRSLTVDMGGGEMKEFAPGDEIPGFEDWPNEAKHAHLSQEIVTLETVSDKKSESKATAAPKPAVSEKKKVATKK